MANNQNLKNDIASVIKTNGSGDITGALLQSVLFSIINQFSIGGLYRGLAKPSTAPGVEDINVFYFATEAGIYPNFDAEVKDGEIVVFSNITGTWVKDSVLNYNSIDKIEKTNTVGNFDTYTVYMTNGTTTHFTVKNADENASLVEWFPRVYQAGETVTKDSAIWRVKNNEVAEYNNIPGSSVKWEPLGTTAKKEFNVDNNIDPPTMKAISKRYDNALDGFLGDKKTDEKIEITMPQNNEVKNQYFLKDWQRVGGQGLDSGDILVNDLKNYDYLVVEGDLSRAGNDGMYIGGIGANGSAYDALCFGIINDEYWEIEVSLLLKYEKLAYTRADDGAIKFYKENRSSGVNTKNIKEYIDSKPSGYAGEIDCGALGVKESNNAIANTAIINQAIKDGNTKKKIVRLPPGVLKINTIDLMPDSILLGAGVLKTRLVAEVGSTSNVAIQFNGKPQARVTIKDMWIDCANFLDGAIFLNLTFDAMIENVIVFNAKLYGFYLERCLYHKLNDIYMQDIDGIGLVTIDNLQMATNLIAYNRLYIVKCKKLCVQLNGGSNYVFNSCNFEDSGTAGDQTTGGVHAIELSPDNYGVDVVFNNCWSEGVKGGFVYMFQNCNGSSVIRDSMLGNGGNGAGNISNAIVNINSKLELAGATKFSFAPYPTNVLTTGGSTIVSSPHINVGSRHTETAGGTFKTVMFS